MGRRAKRTPKGITETPASKWILAHCQCNVDSASYGLQEYPDKISKVRAGELIKLLMGLCGALYLCDKNNFYFITKCHYLHIRASLLFVDLWLFCA